MTIYCVLLSVTVLHVHALLVVYYFVLLLGALGIPQCVGHSLYGSTPQGPEGDSVESKHVSLLSHYTLYRVSHSLPNPAFL